MMGWLDRDQGRFLYFFNLEEVVPEDHLTSRNSSIEYLPSISDA
jgi:hypothetical protein